MALPYPIAPSQTDAKSPVDDNLMDSIRLDLDYLDSLAATGSYVQDFFVEGPLVVAQGYKRCLAAVRAYKAFTPNTIRISQKKSGNSGKTRIDIRRHKSVKIPIIGVDFQYQAATQTIGLAGSSINTQSITAATPAVGGQGVTYVKSTINVQSIVNIGGDLWQYNLAIAPDADWLTEWTGKNNDGSTTSQGIFVRFASCTSAANNGIFQIVEVNRSGLPCVVVTNASGVDQTSAAGTAQLELYSIQFTNPVSSTYFIPGEFANAASFSPALPSTIAIYKINQTGNNILFFGPNGSALTQGAGGTVGSAYWVYTYLAAVGSDYVVGEYALMASHSNANNNGNRRILQINNGGNNLVVYSTAGVAQGGVAGNANTNRWIYSLPSDPSSQISVGDTVQLEGHTTSTNNGNFTVVQVNRSSLNNIVVYNQSGAAQAGVAGTTGTARKLIKFSSDQSANFTTDSYIEMIELVSGFYNLASGRDPWRVLQVNRGGGANYNVVINAPGCPSQANPAGYVMTEAKSLLTAIPELNTSLTSIEPNDFITTSTTSVVASIVPSGTVLGLYILELQNGCAEDLTVTMHN